MKEVILFKGLPGSGKTTWANKMMERNPGRYKRVNKDDLRAMLDLGRWSRDNEKMILNLRDEIILKSLEDGYHVIVDDTNLHPKHEEHIKQIIKGKAKLVIFDGFLDVNIEDCIKNDLNRRRSVGEKVIRKMYDQFLKPKAEVYTPVKGTVPTIICDIDGTLARMVDRSPYDYLKVHGDAVHEDVADIVRLYHRLNFTILIVSGRKAECENQTVDWLNKNNIPYNLLYMRKDGDDRKDYIVKKEIFDNYIRENFDVRFVLDDRNQVVEMWRSIGLRCLQVAEGNF